MNFVKFGRFSGTVFYSNYRVDVVFVHNRGWDEIRVVEFPLIPGSVRFAGPRNEIKSCVGRVN